MWHDADNDLDDDQDDETVPCPHCQESVYEDAEQCPSCGKYLSREDIPRRRPAWIVVGVVIVLAIMIYEFLP